MRLASAPDESKAITAAMQRLLAGRPLRSSGDLTIVALAEEAGLRRNKFTHKHTDLKDLFYAEVKARKGISRNEIKLREQIRPEDKDRKSAAGTRRLPCRGRGFRPDCKRAHRRERHPPHGTGQKSIFAGCRTAGTAVTKVVRIGIEIARLVMPT